MKNLFGPVVLAAALLMTGCADETTVTQMSADGVVVSAPNGGVYRMSNVNPPKVPALLDPQGDVVNIVSDANDVDITFPYEGDSHKRVIWYKSEGVDAWNFQEAETIDTDAHTLRITIDKPNGYWVVGTRP